MYSLDSINALIDDQNDITPALHASSAVLIFAAYDHLSKIYNWRGAGDELTDGERDEIDAMIGLLYSDMLTKAGAAMDVGTVYAYAGISAATTMKSLLCDGATYLKVDYPELYAELASIFIIDANSFKVPELRGRSIIGTGLGPGLIVNRPMGANGGAIIHTLSITEMPIHHHQQRFYATATGTFTGATGAQDTSMSNPVATVDTLDTGSGGAHNNMHPYFALNMYIRALP